MGGSKGSKGSAKGASKGSKGSKGTGKGGSKDAKEVVKYIETGGLCVCGEALIDFVPCKTTAGNGAFRPAYGGSPMNCCIAAQRLGIPVTFLGGLSTDMFGEQLHTHLKGEGVLVDLCPRLPNPTTLAFVSRGEGGEQYAFFKENAADRSLTKAHVESAMKTRKFRAVHMSLGAVTLEHQKCTEAFQTLFNIAGGHGSLRSFDPNIRANMITETPQKYSKRVEKMLRSVDLVKCSEEDAEFLYGKDVDISDLASKWIKLGPKLVVFTLGANGAVAFIPGPDSKLIRRDQKLPQFDGGSKTLSKEGKAAAVCDTVGAGDTFMGGLITGCLGASSSTLKPQLVKKEPFADRDVELVEDVLKLAVTAAAMNCSCFGCDPPRLTEAEKSIVEGPFKHLKLREDTN